MSEVRGYFDKLQDALHRAEVCQPVLVLDMDQLDANVDRLLRDLPTGMAYRVVAKSLPCAKLLAHVRARAGTHRVMTFNLPMLLQLATLMPDADQLLGKPLPVAAAARFVKDAPAGALARVQWLIDTPRRLAEYEDLARRDGVELAIAIELDVGLHRGGFAPGAELRAALERVREGDGLRFTGFVGYEPHVTAVPPILGWQDRLKRTAWSIYGEALAIARDVFDPRTLSAITRNAGGSPTFRLYGDTAIANELAVGSALVKPTHFDTPLLESYRPACFIATPVLKVTGPTRIPGLGLLDPLRRALGPRSARTVFVHGGKWMAEPVHPAGLSYNATYGRSSNQEMLNGPAGLALAPDDFVFLRPHQSEAVFLQFGDLAVFRDGEIRDWWPSLPVSA